MAAFGVKKVSKLSLTKVLAVMLFGPLLAFAHKEKPLAHHLVLSAEQIQSINSRYMDNVRPIFQQKCFDCHTSQTRYPWYHSIPGIKQMLENDIKEAKVHLDFTPDFPFKSHANPIEDLETINEEIDKNEMPPVKYRVMHPGTALTDDEKQKVRAWVQFGKETLKAKE